MMIFDSVQAILKKELNQYLKKDIYLTLKTKMKREKEPFGVFHSETGETTFIGSLAAILLCQQHLTVYLRRSTSSKMEIPILKVKNEESETCSNILPSHNPLCSRHMVKVQSDNSPINCTQNVIFPQTNQEINKKRKLQSNVQQEKDYPNSISISNIVNFDRSCDPKVAHASYSSFSENINLVSSAATDSHLKYSCNLCPFKSMKKQFYLKHHKYHAQGLRGNVKSDFDYEKNDHDFASVEDFHQHQVNREHGKKERKDSSSTTSTKTPKNFLCKICGFGAKLQREYKKHIESAHPITYSCSQCEYKTCKKVQYLRHIRNVHDKRRPFKCNTCGVAFKRCDALKQHRVIHLRNSKTKTPFQCEICHKVVRSAPYLREHMLTHSDERSFLCEICGAAFKTRPVHRNHMKVVHSQALQALCKSCNKTFATKYSLSRHERQHEQHENRTSKNWKVAASSSTGDKGGAVIAESNACNDKTIDSIYTEFSSTENFNMSIDNQIPYIIDSTQEVITE